MFLPEILLAVVDLGLLALNVKLGLQVYERYILLPRLRADRDAVMHMRWMNVKWEREKLVKAKSARLRLLKRHAVAKALGVKPKNVVKLRNGIKVRHPEKKAA